jgi:hypothetical protein
LISLFLYTPNIPSHPAQRPDTPCARIQPLLLLFCICFASRPLSTPHSASVRPASHSAPLLPAQQVGNKLKRQTAETAAVPANATHQCCCSATRKNRTARGRKTGGRPLQKVTRLVAQAPVQRRLACHKTSGHSRSFCEQCSSPREGAGLAGRQAHHLVPPFAFAEKQQDTATADQARARKSPSVPHSNEDTCHTSTVGYLCDMYDMMVCRPRTVQGLSSQHTSEEAPLSGWQKTE